jgi:hypothetical protein
MAGGKEAKLAEHHLPTGDGGPQTQPRLGNEVVGALELKSTGLSFLDDRFGKMIWACDASLLASYD